MLYVECNLYVPRATPGDMRGRRMTGGRHGGERVMLARRRWEADWWRGLHGRKARGERDERARLAGCDCSSGLPGMAGMGLALHVVVPRRGCMRG